MKKITESQLKDRVNCLKEYMAEIESSQQNEGVWDAIKGVGQQVLGATQAQSSAGKPAAGAWPTTPDAIKAFQKANGLVVDGLIGAKTYAAMTQQGMKPPAGFTVTAYKPPATGSGGKPATGAAPQTQTQANMAAAGMAGAEMRTPAEIAASQDLSSANNAGNINAGLTPDDPRWQGAKPPAPAAPAGMQATGDDEGNTTITRPDGSTMVVGADGKQIMPGSNPNLPQNKGVINTVKNAVTGQGNFQKPTGFIPPATQESVSLDEVARLVSLVHYR